VDETIEYAAATGALSSIWLLIALPVFSATVLLLGGKRLDSNGPLMGTATVALTFVLSVFYVITLAGQDNRSVSLDVFSFIPASGLQVQRFAGRLREVVVDRFTYQLMTERQAIFHCQHQPGPHRLLQCG